MIENSVLDINSIRDYFSRKSVAVIANSSTLLEDTLGNVIDDHDIVIRFNSFKILKKHTGEKTNIHATIYLNDYNYNIACDYRIINSGDKNKWGLGVKKTESGKQKGVFNYISNSFNDYPKDGYTPTTGFFVISLLHKYGNCKQINLFGFTFYKNGVKDLLRLDEVPKDIYNKHHYSYEHDWVIQNYEHNINTKIYSYAK